jgi:hypothetical protein
VGSTGSAGDGLLPRGAAGSDAVACARLVHPAQGEGVEGKHCRTMVNTIAYSRPSCGGHTSAHRHGQGGTRSLRPKRIGRVLAHLTHDR